MRKIICAAIALSIAATLSAATKSVQVNADGTFTPRSITINSGDTVEWTFNGPADSIIPVNWDGVSTAYCSATKPYDPNGFAGPMPLAVGGILTLSPLDA